MPPLDEDRPVDRQQKVARIAAHDDDAGAGQQHPQQADDLKALDRLVHQHPVELQLTGAPRVRRPPQSRAAVRAPRRTAAQRRPSVRAGRRGPDASHAPSRRRRGLCEWLARICSTSVVPDRGRPVTKIGVTPASSRTGVKSARRTPPSDAGLHQPFSHVVGVQRAHPGVRRHEVGEDSVVIARVRRGLGHRKAQVHARQTLHRRIAPGATRRPGASDRRRPACGWQAPAGTVGPRRARARWQRRKRRPRRRSGRSAGGTAPSRPGGRPCPARRRSRRSASSAVFVGPLRGVRPSLSALADGRLGGRQHPGGRQMRAGRDGVAGGQFKATLLIGHLGPAGQARTQRREGPASRVDPPGACHRQRAVVIGGGRCRALDGRLCLCRHGAPRGRGKGQAMRPAPQRIVRSGWDQKDIAIPNE